MLNLFTRRPRHSSDELPRLHSVLAWERDHVRAAVVKLSEGVADLLGVGVSPVHGLGRAQYPDPERWFLGADLALTQAEDLTEHGNYRRKVVADSVTMSVPDGITRCLTVTPHLERNHPLRPLKDDDVQSLLRRGYREAVDLLDRDRALPRHVITCGAVGQMQLDGRAVLDPVGLQGTMLDAGLCFFTAPIEWVRTLETLAAKLEVALSSIVPQRLALASPIAEGFLAVLDEDETFFDLVNQGSIIWSVRSEMGAAAIVDATLAGLPLERHEHLALMHEYRRGALEQRHLDLIATRYWSALQAWMGTLRDGIPEAARRRPPPETHYGLDLTKKTPEALQAFETPFWESALSFARCPRSVPLESLKGGRVIDWTRRTSSLAPLALASLAYYAARQFGPGSEFDRALLDIIDWRGAA
jgi:hypothetical protein